MPQSNGKSFTDLALVQLIPNMLTIAAICAGLSAIRFAVQGGYEIAVQLIVAACILDGLDGKIARLLGGDSKIGAELDSLADFVNFGVAPPLVIYLWALQDMRSAAWLCVLVFAICCVLRLARFNVSNKADDAEQSPSDIFVGVPAPAGAILVLLPMSASFAFSNQPLLPEILICAHMVLVGIAMISRIPTWSPKRVRISHGNIKFFLLGFALICATLLTYAWITLVILSIGYIGVVIWSLFGKSSDKFDKEK
ncbi:MAG: CDP-diacylglycerol--serine O-phosphatidyltransferase [Pseudomonadota bacterium]